MYSNSDANVDEVFLVSLVQVGPGWILDIVVEGLSEELCFIALKKCWHKG